MQDTTGQRGESFIIEFDPIRKVLRGTYRGELTDQVLLASNNASRVAIAHYEPAVIVADFSDIETLNITSQCIHRLALFEPELPGNAPIFVVAPAEHVFGMARMYEILSSSRNKRVVVVRTCAEAYSRVEMDNPQFVPIDLP